jgi:hypothetical protein
VIVDVGKKNVIINGIAGHLYAKNHIILVVEFIITTITTTTSYETRYDTYINNMRIAYAIATVLLNCLDSYTDRSINIRANKALSHTTSG